MPWKMIEANWCNYAEDFVARFPATDTEAVTALAGSLKGLREYLAIAHDLTLAEAGEAVDSWLDSLQVYQAKAA